MNNKTPQVYQGRCQCGDVSYEVEGKPEVVAHCYCQECQRGSGGGHTTGAMFRVDSFHLTGQVSKYEYISDNGNKVSRFFCPRCGSPIFGQNSGMGAYLTITLGTLKKSSDFKPEVAIFTRNRKKWDIVDKTILMFEAQPNWKPDDDT